jgi:multidrug efflux pump subunit AcrA (membrane-fusion protein)
LRSVLVEEGDHIRKGQVLAVLENDDYRAQVLAAQADVSAKEASSASTTCGSPARARAMATRCF